ncbi:MAG: hypothetical protein FWD57_10765, partial [Polyangiaceae bacterium]|nr:hypothetical protein [Polyangiaceae bacterium]
MCSQIKSEYCPSTVPSPGDSIADILEERGITTSAFANSIGYPIDVVAGIISGDAPINKGIALQLERVLG